MNQLIPLALAVGLSTYPITPVLPEIQTRKAPNIIITEIMQNPNLLRDTEGEWFELFNASEIPINLSGWVIKDDKTDFHVISPNAALFIPSEGAIVLCQNDDETLNGDVPCDYEYFGVILDNNDDELILLDPTGAEVDRVEYDGGPEFPSPEGASMFFTGTWAEDNNDGSLWQAAFERAPNFENDDCPSCTDLGSPGRVDEAFLPVHLASFDVLLDGNVAKLVWETASESNNAGFEIEHRQDGEAFAPVGWVEGAGTSNAALQYAYSVSNLGPGLHAFRLKQIDFDGAFAFSAVLNLTVDVEGYFVERPYPNPFNPETTVAFGVDRDQRVTVELVDLLGRRVHQAFDGQATAHRSYRVRLSGDGLPSGRYLVHIRGESFRETHAVYLVK